MGSITRRELINQIKGKRSFLCVGLDTDINKLPEQFKDSTDPVFEFNKEIIDGTQEFCVAYKLNMAFYEALGERGWRSLYKTLNYIPKNILKIADAKRGDIGNTSAMYAKAFFETLNFDAITVSPYMGEDSVLPYFNYKDKWVIILTLTSNHGSHDFQMLKTGKEYLFEKVARKIKSWGTPKNTMLVAGATHPEMIEKIRYIVPDHFLLVPGIGEQGGDLSKISEKALTSEIGLLVNVSRSIIYASHKSDFRIKSVKAAYQIQREMEMILKKKKLL
ncbi:MAG TPA: orotidine-5'-phosphate decarboxylase [Chitinophagales bacterium]|nr:orotidine-5'-phosphate decarboxylase [Chitinophagales bacterium]